MIRYDAGTTSPTLLNRLGNWRDHEAWVDFVMRYDPAIRSASRRFRLDAETTEELCQRVWIDLARRMRTFRYDPGKTFRGWLRRLCRSRAIAAESESDDGAPLERPLLLRQAEEVQAAVRRRVDERTWQVFWDIAVDGQSIRESSEAAGISYFAAFAAQKRVGRMLREEGQRLLADRRVHEHEHEAGRTRD